MIKKMFPEEGKNNLKIKYSSNGTYPVIIKEKRKSIITIRYVCQRLLRNANVQYTSTQVI